MVLIMIMGMVNEGHAQTEEDILNSIGNELEGEEAKKKEQARIDKEYKSLKSSADAAYSSKKYEKANKIYTVIFINIITYQSLGKLLAKLLQKLVTLYG